MQNNQNDADEEHDGEQHIYNPACPRNGLGSRTGKLQPHVIPILSLFQVIKLRL
jgi:hypothetical protein